MRIGPYGSERPAIKVGESRYIDVAATTLDFGGSFFERGVWLLEEIVVDRNQAGQIRAFAGGRIGAPIARPHQILCIGLNYCDHAAQTGQQIPTEPILFTKSPNTLAGPDADVRIPRTSTKTDWEVELGLVIGTGASHPKDTGSPRAAIHVDGLGAQRQLVLGPCGVRTLPPIGKAA